MVSQIVSDCISRISLFYDKTFDPQVVEYITNWWWNRNQEPSQEELDNLLSWLVLDHSGAHVSIEDLLDSNVFETDVIEEAEYFCLRTELFS